MAIKFNFKKDIETTWSSGPYYDLFDGGYIRPEEMLEDVAQIDAVFEAMQTIQEFLKQAEDAGVLDFY